MWNFAFVLTKLILFFFPWIIPPLCYRCGFSRPSRSAGTEQAPLENSWPFPFGIPQVPQGSIRGGFTAIGFIWSRLLKGHSWLSVVVIKGDILSHYDVTQAVYSLYPHVRWP